MITVIAGGTGSVKLVRGLAALSKNLKVITNVADNIWLLGLYVCPDIDTMIYGLAGLLDDVRGWGVKSDSFECLGQLRRIGAPSWFGLGDKDLATHLRRTDMIREGKRLSEITLSTCKRYSIKAKIIPATDDPVATIVKTNKGEMHLQEFWVKHRGTLKITGIKFQGSDRAVANDDAIDAIERSKTVIVAPANPVSSIGPTIALNSIRAALERKRDCVCAVSPLIGANAISGPAVKYMKALGLENSPLGVAKYYRDFVGNFVISEQDHRIAEKIRRLGMRVYETEIKMQDRQQEIRLARFLMDRFDSR